MLRGAAITDDLLRALPKTDLHVHLDGSIRLGTLIELARDYHVDLPSYTEEGLRETVFKDRYQNLKEYLHGFSYTVAVMQSEAALERGQPGQRLQRGECHGHVHESECHRAGRRGGTCGSHRG